jgi:hypothetical protein
MDRKFFAGVNAILRISSSELNRRLMIKSADSFRMPRQQFGGGQRNCFLDGRVPTFV